ncbi:MAG: lysophospholipid acyltransferase family protein [Sulfuricaulis sp.]
MDNQKLEKDYREAVQQMYKAIVVEGTQAYAPLDAARTSANVFHLLPQVPVDAHPELLRQIYFNQRRAHADQYHLDVLLRNVTEEGVGLSAIFGGRPSIVCAYHYGAYRLVLPHLMTRGVKVSMLIDHRVAQAQGTDFQDILGRMCAQRGLPAENFRIRDTANPSMLLSLMRDIRAGYSVLVFLDGNIGADRDPGESAHTIPVPFLDATLHSRGGVAALSHMARCPIVPVLTPRTHEAVWASRFEALAPIVPENEARDAYVRRACAAMWSPLDWILRVDPLPWESWRYVDRSLDLDQLQARHRLSHDDADPAQVMFDDQRYALSDENDEPVLFDRLTYRVRTITPTMFGFLQQFRGTPRSRDDALAQPKMTPQAWRQLVTLGVLKAA